MTDDKPAATSSDELTGDDLVKRVIERVPTWCFSEDPKERERAAYLASVGISNLVKHILHPPPIVEDHEMPEVAPIRKRVRPGT